MTYSPLEYVGNTGNKPIELDLISKALSQVDDSDFNAAAITATQILDNNPKNAEALAIKGYAIFSLGYKKNGMKELDKALDVDPNNSLALVYKGLTMKDRDEGIKFVDKALDVDPNSKVALFYKGGYEVGNGETDFMTYFNKALEIDPNYKPALLTKAIMYSIIDHDEGLEMFEDLLKKYPNDKNILSNYAYSLYELKRYDDAIKYANQALDIDPNNRLSLDTKEKIQHDIDDD